MFVAFLAACGTETSEASESFQMPAAAPRGELVPFRTSIDDHAHRHVRLRQMHRGVPVLGGESVAHYDAAGRLLSSHRSSVEHLDDLDVTPRISRDAAVTIAGGALRDARLVIMTPRRKAAPILAWEGRTPDDHRVTVDAETGRIVQNTSLRPNERGSGKGVFGDTRDVEYIRDFGENLMIDETRSTKIVVLDAKNGTSLERAEPFRSFDGDAWDTRGPAAGAAVDAAYHVGVTLDFFEEELDRKGWENRSHGEVVLLVHYGREFENAQYSPADKSLNFGDGGNSQYPLAAFLDIVAHEFTHGVTAEESGLDYAGEPGALNEAMSDIFGAIVEHGARPDERRNWLHGEGSLKNSEKIEGADRDFTNPHDSVPWQPAHMNELVDPDSDEDNGGVHSNSGIVNQAAWLMTAGGTNPVSHVTVKNGIGWKKLAKLFYKLNTDYLHSRSDFADAAGGSLDAARELGFSKAEIDTITCAWQAVGVLDGTCEQPEYQLSGHDSEAADRESDLDETKPASKTKTGRDTPVIGASCTMGPDRSSSKAWTILLLAAVLIAVRKQRVHADAA